MRFIRIVVFVELFASVCLAQETKDFSEISLDSLLSIPVSTAAKHQQSAQVAPASVTVITAEDIAEYGYTTLAEALNSVHGFYLSYDRNYVYLGVRGFSRPTDYNNRILLMLNGHVMNENVYESALIGTDFPIAMNAIERIEIVRGPGSALYGTNAVFAMINVITRTGQELEGIKAAGSAGSNGWYEGSGTVGLSFGPTSYGSLAVRAGSYAGSDLFYPEFLDSPEGGIARGRDWDRYGSVLANATIGQVTLSGFFSSRQKSVPTASFETLFNAKETTLDQRSYVEGRYATLPGEKTQFTARAYFDQYNYSGIYEYADGEEPDASTGVWVGGETQMTWDMFPTNRIIAGVEYQHHFQSDYRLWTINEILFAGDFPFHVGSAYLQDEWQATRALSLLASVRKDIYSRAGSTIAPRFAIVYTPATTTSLKLLYAEAFRVPNTYELYYQDPQLGYLPSKALSSEFVRSVEFVVESRISDQLHVSASAFQYRLSDLIDLTVNPEDSTYIFQNASAVNSRGVEVQVNGDFAPAGHGYLSYTYADAESDQGDSHLTNSPMHVFRAGFEGTIVNRLSAACEIQAESRRVTVQGNYTPSFGLLNFTVRYATPIPGLNARLRCTNVLDAQYAYPGGYEHLQNAIDQDGRRFLFTLFYSIGLR